MEKFKREEMLIGSSNLEKLKNSHVAVFGIGGVGSYVCEALIRAGVGKISVIDSDTVSVSNINRQLIALSNTIGKFKVDVIKERINLINSSALVYTYNKFVLPENICDFDFKEFDYVVDALDTVSAKIAIIIKAKSENIKVISSMGTGNKLNPQDLKISDIYKTKVCPLARVLRHELKKRNIKDLKVLYSEEEPIEPKIKEVSENGKVIPGSISFVPSTAGLIIASEVIKDLIKE